MANMDNYEFRILRLKHVQEITGLGRSTIYDRMGKQTFPQSVNLGARAVGWLKHEIDAWLQECIGNRIACGRYDKKQKAQTAATAELLDTHKTNCIEGVYYGREN